MGFAETIPLSKDDNLFEFFHERVAASARHRHVPVSQDTVYYLSNLLAEQARPEEGEVTTLVELRDRAANSSFAESVTWWRRLGDTALVGVGYFREHLSRRRISPNYYAEMGASAYATLSRMLRDPGPGLGDVFGEMSARFDSCTEVLGDVRDDARQNHASDIVRLFEEWQATGSPRVAERLRQLGVVPMRFGGQA